jgi:hypothetical protein
MGFLDPVYLAALAAVAIPLLIHILSRRRVPMIPFSSLRFLRPSDKRSMRRLNLRKVLLLALRMIGVALIVLAFARPTMKGGLAALFPGEGARVGCILLDRSYSMGYEQEGGSLFEQAKKRVTEILREYTPEDEVIILLFDTGRQLIYRGRMNGPLIEELLAGIEISWEATDLEGAVLSGFEMLGETPGGAKELFVVSDFQRSALQARPGGMPGAGVEGAGAARKKEPGNKGPVRCFLVPVRAESAANISLERIRAPRTALHRGELATLELFMRSSVPREAERFPVAIYVDGRLLMEREMTIGPNGRATETFELPTEKGGWMRGEARKRPDRLRADDARYFVLRVRERTRVLLVAGEGAFYLEQALEPEGADGDIELETRPYRGIASVDLDRADVIVLGPGGEPRDKDLALVERFVEGGGAAVVFIVRELAGAAERLSVNAVSIEFPDFGGGFLTIARPTVRSGLLGPFGADDIEALGRLRFGSGAIVSGVPATSVLLAFSDGSPAIWEERRGGGSCLFTAIEPSPDAGDLVLSPYFLPLVQQMVLATGRDRETEEGALVGEPIAQRLAVPGDVVVGLPQTGRGEGPMTVIVPGRGMGGETDTVPPAARAPGFATLEVDGDTVEVVAVNVSGGAESMLAAAEAEEAADSLGLEHWTAIGEGRPAAEIVRIAREGREIAFGLIVAAALILLIESILSQMRYAGKTDVG